MLRGDGLLRNVLEGRMFGSRPQGGPRMDMIDELRKIMIMEDGKKKKESFGSMKRRAEDREGWSFCAKDLPKGRKLMMMMITCMNYGSP